MKDSIAGLQAEIWTQDLQNKKQDYQRLNGDVKVKRILTKVRAGVRQLKTESSG
jgi:hypothetical protein